MLHQWQQPSATAKHPLDAQQLGKADSHPITVLDSELPAVKKSAGTRPLPVSISRSRTVYFPAGSLMTWRAAGTWRSLCPWQMLLSSW